MPRTAKPWWTRPFRTARRDFVSEFERRVEQDLDESAREVKEGFHCNTEWVMANLGCSPGLAHIVTFDTDKFEKLATLGKADLLRDYIPHARRHGVKVLAYINLHWFSYDFANDHPGWEQVLANGEPYGRRHPLYGSGTTMCINSPWRDWAFDLIREATKTGVAGAFLDGPVVFPGACHCDVCRGLFRQQTGHDAPTEEDWRSEVWKSWIEFREESMTKFMRDARTALRSINPEGAIYLNGGSYHAGAWRVARDIQKLADCQDINGAEAFFHASSAKHYLLASALLGKYLGARNRVSQVYTHHALGSWHYIPLPTNEMKLALAQTLATGSNTWFAVWDRSLAHSRGEAFAGVDPNGFAERCDAYFAGTTCAARIAMLIGSAANHWYLSQLKELYVSPGSAEERDLIADLAQTAAEAQRRKEVCDGLLNAATTGLFSALARSHLPVEVLWDADVTPEVLKDYDALVLGNVACLSAAQKRTICGFVAAGGGLYADFESGMYDERSSRVDDPAWLELLGLKSVEGMFVPSRSEDYLAIVDSTAPFEAYVIDQLLPRPVHMLQVRAAEGASVPALVTVPLGQPYIALKGNTNYPGVVLNTFGKGRVAYCPGALSSVFGELGMLQHQDVIARLVRWVMKDAHPLNVRAPQSVYVEWRRKGRSTDLIHLVNNSGDMHRPIGEFIPARNIVIELARKKVSRVRSLRLDKELRHTFRDGTVRATLPVLEQYDVVVIE
jgi:hypothetical protein